MTTKIGVAIVGASGYAARELIRIMLNHPHAEITAATSRSDEEPRLEALHPSLARRTTLKCEAFDAERLAGRALFRLPGSAAYREHGRRSRAAPARRAGDRPERRLSPGRPAGLRGLVWPRAYRCRAALADAVYGLPELFREQIPPAGLIANPGCYTSASILALAPLIAEDLIERTGIIIDAKSGVSGAGRSPKLTYHFPECNENLSAYSVGRHRHTPEIDQVLTEVTGGRGDHVEVIFTPHLVPMDRGIFATIYAQPKGPAAVEHDLLALYRWYYARSPFIRDRRPLAGDQGFGIHELLRHHRSRRARADRRAGLSRQSHQGSRRRGRPEPELDDRLPRGNGAALGSARRNRHERRVALNNSRPPLDVPGPYRYVM